MTYKQAIEWLTEARAAIVLGPGFAEMRMPGRAMVMGSNFWTVFNALKKQDEDLYSLGYGREKTKVIYIKEKTV